jgi:gliding motility-associated-like protein
VNQNVIVHDTTNPVTPMLANVTGQCSATATVPTTTDNCAGTISGTTNDPLTYTTQGTHIIHWTFSDGNGNSITVNQNVIVDDTTNPVTPMLTNVTGQCSATATVPTTTDNCAGTINGTTTDPLTYTTQGTHIIHWTFSDGNGNSITVNQNVIVDDTTNPVTPMLANVTGQCSATATTPTTTDNCAGTINGTTTDPLTYTTQGTHVIHWTFSDGNGNSITVNQNVIVHDTINPITPMLANVTGQCSATATVPTTTDNCAGTISGTTNDPLTYTTQGTHIIHWTFNDGNGNSISVNQNVIVHDTTNPITPMLANVTGQCSATATTPTTTDNCAGTISVTTNDPLTYITQGTHIIHWTFSDGNGNSITVNQNVIVHDTTNPVTPMLANVTGQCSATATVPTTTDNCAGTISGTTNDPLTYTTQGTHIIHWTFSDGNGNSITVNQNVIVDDTTNPVTPMLTNVTGQCSATATVPTTTDNCAGTINGTTTDPLTYTTQGTHIIHWTFSDGNGNSITVNQNVIVDDTTNPVTPMLANVTGQCSATATVPTTTDNCAGTINGTTNDLLTYTTQGTHVIHWNFNDGNGNSITVNQNVIVDDTTNPITPMLANVTGQCSATATVPTTTDNCAGTISGTTNDPLTYTTQGTFIIHWHFNDGNGNSITVTQNVIVDDTTNPDTPILNDIISQCYATATAPTTTDNCSQLPIVGTTTDPLTYNMQGNFVIHWLFNDGNGNIILVDQNVIIHDTTPPMAPVLEDVIGQCSATAPVPSTYDNCSEMSIMPILGTTNDPLTYNTQGTHIIHWTFSDGNGNSIQVNQNVIVDDTTNPEILELADVTGQCSATATVPSTMDNCAGTINGTTTDPLTYNTQGTHVIHWTFNDGNGNSIQVNQNVIVDDTINPETPELADVTGQCSATATVPSTMDNCAGTINGTTTDPLTYNTQGTHIIHWTFSDGNGNSISVNQNMIVHDTINPITPMLVDLTGQCSATATTPTTTDNCAGTINGTTTDPLTYTTQGTHIIHWTFSDGNGNSISINQNVIVHDTINPVTPTLANVTGQCSATATTPTTTDNCAGTINGTTTDPLTYTTQGTHIIHWTFSDGNGNSINVNQNVIVQDNTNPLTPMLVDVTGQCSATAVTPTTTDNCAGTINGTTTDPLTYTTQGTHIIHWTFNDGNGNIITVNQSVIISDTTPPVTLMLANISGICSVTVDIPTTTDNCAELLTGTTTDPLTYSLHGNYIVHWTFDDGHGNSITVNQNVAVTQEDLIVHNAFSPNNDGLNEFFNIENIENTICFPSNRVEIYNRWGVLVYETDQYDNNSRVFKGISEGRVTIDRAMELPTGTYYYILNYTTSEGEYLNKKGYVYLSK